MDNSVQNSSSEIRIIGIDPSDFPKIIINVFIDEDYAREGNLKKENFQVMQGNTDASIENFSFFGGADGQKLDLAFVIDDTKYMASQINALQFEVKDLMEKIKSRKINARYSLVTFKAEAATRSNWTDDESLKKALSRVYATQGRDHLPSNSLAGIETALSFGFRPDARKVIIVVTIDPSCQKGDGTSEDLPLNASYVTEDVKRDICNSGATLIAISPDFKNSNTYPKVPLSNLEKYADMRDLANDSCGLWMDINSKKFSTILEQLEGIITDTYTIEFMSPDKILAGRADVLVAVNVQGFGKGSGLKSYIAPENLIRSVDSNKTPVINGRDRGSQQNSRLVAVLGNPSNPKHSVAFSPDGLIIASGGENGVIVLWNANSSKLFRTMRGHSGNINSVAFSPIGGTLASAGDDGMIKVWNATNGSLIRTIKGHSSPVECVVFSPDGRFLASAGDDCTIKLWNATNGLLIKTFKGHTGNVWGISFSPDCLILASASDDRTVRLWNASNGSLIRTLVGHTNHVVRAKFSPDGHTIASASRDRTVRLWDAFNGTLIGTLQYDYPINDIAFSPNGFLLVSVCDDRTFRLWYPSNGTVFETRNGVPFDEEDGHTNYVKCVAFSPDGRSFATGSDDSSVKLWKFNEESGLNRPSVVSALNASEPTGGGVRMEGTMEGEPNDVEGVAFSPDGRIIATASDDGTARLWDASNGSLIKMLVSDPVYVEEFDELNISKSHSNFVESVSFSPDGRTLATGSDDGTIRLWDISKGSLTRTINAHLNDVEGVAFSLDGRIIATASDDGTVKQWNAASGAFIRALEGNSTHEQSDHMEFVAFSPDGHTIAAVSEGGVARLWDAATGSLIRIMEGNYTINIVAFSPDGSMIASGSDDGAARLWNASDRSLIRTLEASSTDVESVAFSPDGRTLAAGADDGNVTQWDLSTGSVIRIVCGHTNDIESIAFSSDSHLLVSGSDDGTIRLWRLE